MCTLILICDRCKINPDNVATPIASALGDLFTLCLMWQLTAFLYQYHGNTFFLSIHMRLKISFTFFCFLCLEGFLIPLLLSICLLILPIMAFFTWRNSTVKSVLYHGWVPLIISMLISRFGLITFFIHIFFDI